MNNNKKRAAGWGARQALDEWEQDTAGSTNPATENGQNSSDDQTNRSNVGDDSDNVNWGWKNNLGGGAQLSVYEDVMDTKHDRTTTPENFIQDIRNGQYRKTVATIRERYAAVLRSSGDHEVAHKDVIDLKKKLPAVTLSGTFPDGHSNDFIESHSGLVVIDVDGQEGETLDKIKSKAAKDPHCLAAFISPSGAGIKLVFRVDGIDANTHRQGYLTAKRHVEANYGIRVEDTAGIDVSRLTYYSWDEDAYFNPDATPLPMGKFSNDQEPGDANGEEDHAPPDISEQLKREDEVLLSKAQSAKNCAKFKKLWEGKWQDGNSYSSQSEADAALLAMLRFWTGGDKSRSIRLFRQSGMYREKSDRPGYLFKTWAAIDHGKVYQPPRSPEAYYNQSRKEYLVKNASGEYFPMSLKQFQILLGQSGFSRSDEDGSIDAEIVRVQHECSIHLAGEFAGHREGLHTFQGKRILVTKGPTIIKPKKGDWATIHSFLMALLGDDSDEELTQLVTFLCWLKIAYASLSGETFRPGQAIAFVGPAGCGKSFLQNYIITPVLGGRHAKPHQFMSDKTSFNLDLIGCEHLIIDDEVTSKKIEARRNLGAHIKKFVANPTQRCHPKFGTAFECVVFQRLTLSLNDEPEDLCVLPTIDQGTSDKIMLMKCFPDAIPVRTTTEEERLSFARSIIAELPAFLWFIINDCPIPTNLESARYGVTHQHHADILRALVEMAPEWKLLSMIDDSWKLLGGESWKGKAEQLAKILTDVASPVRREAQRLLHSPSVCGIYLGRIRKAIPDRVQSRNHNGRQIWIVCRAGHVGDVGGAGDK